MKNFLLSITFLFTSYLAIAQVAVGTTNPDDGSAFQVDSSVGAFVPPRMTQTQMNNIPTPLEGALVYNTTRDAFYMFNGSGWIILGESKLPTLLLNKSSSGTFQLRSNTFFQLPIGNTDVSYIDSDYFTVISNGKIRIEEDGIYSITAGISTSNLPAGSRKYIIAVYQNNTLIGYVNRGNVDLPSQDFWGTSGSFLYEFADGDEIDLKYVINRTATTNETASVRFINLGFTKIN